MAQSVQRSRPATKRDVELAQANAEILKARATIERWAHLGVALRWGVTIASTALPILALQKVLEPFAGKDTNVHANVVVSVSVVASLTLGGAALVKIMNQRRTIKRLRDRVDDLEQGRL